MVKVYLIKFAAYLMLRSFAVISMKLIHECLHPILTT